MARRKSVPIYLCLPAVQEHVEMHATLFFVCLFWLDGEMSSQEDDEVNRELILFSGNDYMCLSSHPAVREAAVKVLISLGLVLSC